MSSTPVPVNMEAFRRACRMNRTTVDAARSLGISTTRFNEIAAEESVETPSKRRKRETRTEKDLDIIKRQTAEIERLHMQMKTKPLWAEL